MLILIHEHWTCSEKLFATFVTIEKKEGALVLKTEVCVSTGHSFV